jgi:hypothetical protein
MVSPGCAASTAAWMLPWQGQPAAASVRFVTDVALVS